MATHTHDYDKNAVNDLPSTPESGHVDMVEKVERGGGGVTGIAAYGHDHLHPTLTQAEEDDRNPNIYNHVCILRKSGNGRGRSPH